MPGPYRTLSLLKRADQLARIFAPEGLETS